MKHYFFKVNINESTSTLFFSPKICFRKYCCALKIRKKVIFIGLESMLTLLTEYYYSMYKKNNFFIYTISQFLMFYCVTQLEIATFLPCYIYFIRTNISRTPYKFQNDTRKYYSIWVIESSLKILWKCIHAEVIVSSCNCKYALKCFWRQK